MIPMVWGGGGGLCVVRSKLNTFEHVREYGVPETDLTQK